MRWFGMTWHTHLNPKELAQLARLDAARVTLRLKLQRVAKAKLALKSRADSRRLREARKKEGAE